MTDDSELLRCYAENGDEAAFGEFVRRNVSLVLASAGRRLGGCEHRAHEVAQHVFIVVAREARALAQHRNITAWLFTATRNATFNLMRDERRRARREAALAEELGARETDARNDAWGEILPVLDRAMDELGARDREAVLLRYFAGVPLGEIGRRLGLSENAARMRVQRALEKLNTWLVRKGVTSTAAALGAALTQRAAAKVTSDVAAGIAQTALASALPATGAAAAGALTFMSATKWAAGIASACVLAGLLGTWSYSRHERVRAEETLAAAQRAHAESTAQIAAATERVAASDRATAVVAKRLETARAELAGAKKAAAEAEVARAWDPVAEGTAFMARHPAVKRALERYVDASMRFRFGALFRELGWSDTQIAEFAQLLGRGIGMGARVADGNFVSLRYGEAKPPEDFGPRLTQLLGSDGLRRWDELRKQQSGRFVAREVASALYFSDTPLSPQQARELIEIVTGTNPPKAAGVVPLEWDTVIAKAQERLAPAQIEALAGLRAMGEFHRVLNRPRGSTAAAKSVEKGAP